MEQLSFLKFIDMFKEEIDISNIILHPENMVELLYGPPRPTLFESVLLFVLGSSFLFLFGFIAHFFVSKEKKRKKEEIEGTDSDHN